MLLLLLLETTINLARWKLKVKACKLQVTTLATCSQSQRAVQSMVSAACWLNAPLMTGITDVAPPISLQLLLQLWYRSVASYLLHVVTSSLQVLTFDFYRTCDMGFILTRRAWQSQTWGRPAPQVRVQNQFQEDEIPLAVMASRMRKFSENTSTIPEVMDSSTLNFNPNFKFSWFFFWGGEPSTPSGVC